jgi:ubiquinone/menaquinone biosynthesis C-methylase UbiE
MAKRLHLGARLLATVGCDLRGKRVLDVGCGDGAETFLLARGGPGEVVGTNHGDLLLDRQDDRAQRLRDEIDRVARREHLAPLGPRQDEPAPVSFVDDDISASALETASFDVVCSWETLEHLTEPAAAFTEMYRLLRPGGHAFHEYNSFFCIEGGHSLCTLDFPWGHVRLGAEDFERYVETYRPEEAALAVDYYHRGLNRVSLEGMQACCREAGFEILCFVPRARTEDLLVLSKPIHDQARRVHPRLTINDLVCRMTRLVLRKPCA